MLTVLIRLIACVSLVAILVRMVRVALVTCSPPIAVVALRMRGLRGPARRLMTAWRTLRNVPVKSSARFHARDEFANAVMEAHLAYGSRVPGLPLDPYTDLQ
jgi:hypothetical protein